MARVGILISGEAVNRKYDQSMIKVEFDAAKEAANRRKHRISLTRAAGFDFDHCLYIVDDSQDYGEIRLIALGFLEDALHTLVFSPRGEGAIRAISLRGSSASERKRYAEENW
jgi:hypothetical protein